MSLWDDIRRTPAYESIPTAERAQAVTDAVDAVIANYVTPRGMVAAAAGRLGYHWIAGRTGRQWPIKPLVLLTWEHLGWLSASSLSRHQHTPGQWMSRDLNTSEAIDFADSFNLRHGNWWDDP